MTRNKEIARAVRHALVMSAVVAGGYSVAAHAQQAPETAPTANTPTTVVTVTGSRIPQPQLEAASPVTSVGSVEFQQTGTTRVEDLLNTLPQVFGQYGANVSNGATGAATVSLYGLGANRTLVLINGRRLMPGDPTQNGNAAPDLNQIPAALIERVDVLTGGASAVYGADAVAGVVNFVMNDHFEGVRFDGNYSFYQHDNHDTQVQDVVTANGFDLPPSNVTDGYTRDFTVVLGSNFADGRGNATAYLGYRRTAAVTQARRDYSACSLTSTGGALTCGGSSSSALGDFSIGGKDYTLGGPNGNSLVPFTGLYNYAPLNYFQRPDERYTGGLFAHYDINDHVRAYTELMFTDDRTYAQVAPSGAFKAGLGTTNGIPDASYLINCDNPLLSAQEQSILCAPELNSDGVQVSPDANGNAHVIIGRRLVEGGPRTDDFTHTSYRMLLGFKGEINDSWAYDTYFQNGITRQTDLYTNDVSRLNTANALQAVTENGQIVCKANSGGNSGAPGCVPWNIFQIGGTTPAMVNYLSIPGIQKGTTTERIFNGSITGDLGKYGIQLPTAHEGVGVNFGMEYREEQSELNPDEAFITNDLAGQGAAVLPTVGSFHVWEGFLEARVPILQDMPLAQSLVFDTGYRYSDYDLSFGSTNTYKFQVEWAPIRDVRFRGGYNRAVRAPNIQELFLQPRVQLDGTSDPCAGAAPSASLADCERSGVTPAEYGNIAKNPASQYNGQVGGNAYLRPEKADTYTAGLVFTPTFLPDFNLTVDYYNIKITNFIDTYGADLILATCVNTGDPQFCNLVHRAPVTGSPADGSLWIGQAGYIVDSTLNLGNQRVTGVDVTAQYRLDAGALGRFDFNFAGTYDILNMTEPYPGSGAYDCAGYYGSTCGVPAPKWKHKLKGTWHTPIQALDAWVQWRKIGEVYEEHSSSNPLLSGPLGPPGLRLGGRNYIDVGAQYTLASKYTLRVGVNNLFDKDPPLASAYFLPTVFGNGNTVPQVYDSLGRYIFINATLDF